ncbi:hypothetical protein A3C87_02885 [Candidatus Kaiserbacteria bacterium RIFCSPHIGHO2_02_FULL_49_34]|uniref:Uncharacterized protein n=1 Tax=Candidatus Kaiserbacteria bacterium RIFCSPHIGHO2_02_FULL_49_34 TaxID=1798491 RepID=A0A1F6DJJ8_9BACT|nr:MAG: hypothetical protein A3C87_02885 [Candidatus Kaiserbacteria bacterium RIFCSPHIGHO2_02_FULL_49_34]
MQKKLFVIIGALLVVLTISLFLYVFFIQKAEDQLPTVQESSFPISSDSSTETPPAAFNGNDDAISDDISSSIEASAVATTTDKIPTDVFAPELRFTQLSTKPVVGMSFTGTTTVRYSEQGTGALFELDLLTMETKMIATNLTGVISTTFNSNGSRVLMRIHDGLVLRFFAGVIAENARGEKELRGSFLPNNTVDATFTGVTNIRYLLATSNGGEIHTYEPSTRADSIEATIPFSQAYFATSPQGTTYLITKPSAHMNGTVYRYTPTGITALIKSSLGLTAFAAGDYVYITSYEQKKLRTLATNGKMVQEVHNILNTDKCVASPKTIYCARPYEIPTQEYPDGWYRGEEQHNDILFTLNTQTQRLVSTASPEVETGQIFDILKLVAHPTRDDLLLLINKNNDSLWLFAR